MSTTEGNEPVIKITAINLSEKPVTVHASRLSMEIWEQKPRLEVLGYLKFFRFIDDISGKDPLSFYISDDVVEYSIDNVNLSLSENERLIATIPVNELMKALISSNVTFGSKFYFGVYIFFLNIEVHLTGGHVFKRRAHREIRWYLFKNYANEIGLYQ